MRSGIDLSEAALGWAGPSDYLSFVQADVLSMPSRPGPFTLRWTGVAFTP